jgi:hypothetical protein
MQTGVGIDVVGAKSGKSRFSEIDVFEVFSFSFPIQQL